MASYCFAETVAIATGCLASPLWMIEASFGCTNGAALAAASIRMSRGAFSSRYTEVRYCKGVNPDAAISFSRATLALLGVPFLRPPLRSPGCDPLAIATCPLLLQNELLNHATTAD